MAKLRLPAYTLIESVVSLTLVILITGIAIMVLSSILFAERDRERLQVIAKMDEIAQEAIRAKSFSEMSHSFGKYDIKQNILPYSDNPFLSILHLECALPNSGIIEEYNRIIPKQ